jgi:hypothetical protein
LIASDWLAGSSGTNEWERMGARVMHRLAAEEQTPDGYWGELTDHGPTTGYNALTLSGVGLYWEHSGDPAALEAIRRATDFHLAFTWPDGTPVETINGRNRSSRVLGTWFSAGADRSSTQPMVLLLQSVYDRSFRAWEVFRARGRGNHRRHRGSLAIRPIARL